MLQIERAPEVVATPLEPKELSDSLNPRLTVACAKNATRKHLSTLVAESIRCEFGTLDELRGCADRLSNCSTWLKFREHHPSGKVHLTAGNFCDQHLLCTPCAHQRSLELIRRYGTAVWHSHKRPVRHYMITFTWPSELGAAETSFRSSPRPWIEANKQAIQRALSVGLSGVNRLWERRKRRNSGPFRELLGLVLATEVTHNPVHGWHVHFHGVYSVPATSPGVDVNELRLDWEKLTRGKQLRLDHISSELDLLEVFKYSVKPADLLKGVASTVDQNAVAARVAAWYAFRGKRLIRSYGCYFGLGDVESISDEITPPEHLNEPYSEWLATWEPRVLRYNLRRVD